MLSLPRYILITPARNEADYIELTLKSVVAQTVLPLKWVIVSDGSTDETDAIVTRYAAQNEWIELVRMPARKERHFAGKVLAFKAGQEKVKDLNYEIIANLDGDVSFDQDYFEFLLQKFVANPQLGVAGTPFREGSLQYDYRFTSIEHVSGQIQVFRRECFEAIGGYIPREIGGVDLIAVISARMHGWQTRTFPEKPYEHHRRMGTASAGVFKAAFKVGRADYLLGSHPVWEFARSIYQTTRPPMGMGGILRLAGFTWMMVKRAPKQVPGDLIAFRRKEQMRRLRDFISRLGGGKISARSNEAQRPAS
jgi:glycosyltransferase involved in cell wall biosynthesis